MTWIRAITVCLIACLFVPPADAQLDTLWSQMVRGGGNTILRGVEPLAGGGFVAVGCAVMPDTDDDFFMTRLSDAGEVLWERTYLGSPGVDRLEAVAELPNGNLFIVGHSHDGGAFVMLGANPQGDTLWVREFSPGGTTQAFDATRLADGNVAVIGCRAGTSSLESDVWLLKCAPSGDTLWTRIWDGGEDDIGKRIREMPNGDLVLAGSSSSQSQLSLDFWTVRVDANGDPISDPVIRGTPYRDDVWGLDVASNGDVYIAGAIEPNNQHQGLLMGVPTADDPWIDIYNDEGVEEQLRGVMPRLGSVLVAGWAGTEPNRVRPMILALDPEGDILWEWYYSVSTIGVGFWGIERAPSGGGLAFGAVRRSNLLYGYALRIAPPGGVTGTVVNVADGQPVPGVLIRAIDGSTWVTTDSTGVFHLELLPGTHDIVAEGFCVDADTLFGVEVIENEMTEIGFEVGVPNLIRTQSSINLFAMNHLLATGSLALSNTGSGNMRFAIETETLIPHGDWLSVSPAEGVVPAGQAINVSIQVQVDTTENAVFDFVGELHLHVNSCPDTLQTIPVLVIVLETDEQPATAREFALHPAFPNPFNAATNLRFDVPTTSRVSVILFDVTGRQVRMLADEVYSQGAHHLLVQAGDLPSGVYIVQMRTSSFTTSRKLMLLK